MSGCRWDVFGGEGVGVQDGEAKIRELRERAEQQLGDHFDIKSFHDEILNGGAMPLDLLDARVDQVAVACER